MPRLAVSKTYKLFIGGKFVRSESGRSLQTHGVNYPQSSRKDLRDAVKEARAAFEPWRARTPYNRAQILYRIAEMLESRKREFALLVAVESKSADANREVQAAIDRCVYYCGWADKFDAVFGSVNPVSASYFDFSAPEPMGVVGILADDATPLIGLVSQVMPAIVSGNTCVVVDERFPLTALELGEVLATSDLPGGVVNVLTGEKSELVPHLARHMDVNALTSRDGFDAELVTLATENLKRLRFGRKMSRAQWLSDRSQGPDWIEELTETKTVWHPIGL